MPLRGVIFDVDGTLVDTNRYHVAAWERAFAAAGHPVPAERIVTQVGKGGDQLVPALIGNEAAERDGQTIRDGYTKTFKAIAEKTRFAVFPGAVELIDALRARGVKVALATSSPQDLLRVIERSAGVDFAKLMDVTATADDAGASKPSPDVIAAALNKLGLPAEECVTVGDTPYDVEAARRAGVACWGVTCGGCHPDEGLRAAGAAEVWRDPADLLAHLDAAVAGKQAKS
jgi:HAD superfamily hydrolase (TIGR01509 family)